MDKIKNKKNPSLNQSNLQLDYLKAHKKGVTITALSVVLAVLLIIVVIPYTHRTIRTNQTKALIMDSYKDVQNIEFIPYDKLATTITTEKEITVVLIDPNTPYYEVFEKTVTNPEKMKNYQGKLFMYPIVYNKKKIESFYKLKSGITLIYFEKGIEINRELLDSEKEIELYLLDHLHSVARPSSEELDKAELLRKEEELKAQQKAASEEEVIDELKKLEDNTENENPDEQENPEEQNTP